jgi:hypothetical protein
MKDIETFFIPQNREKFREKTTTFLLYHPDTVGSVEKKYQIFFILTELSKVHYQS